MSNFYICAADPESAASDDLVRVVTVDPDGFCKNQQDQEHMPTYLAEAVNTAIALSDALAEYVNVSADYDVYPSSDFFSIRMSNLRRADGGEEALELPPSYSMLMLSMISYVDCAMATIISVPSLADSFVRAQEFIPRRDTTSDSDLVEISYDSGDDSDAFDITRALYLFNLDTTGTRWSLTLTGSYDIESEKFMDGDDVVSVDEETLDYAKSDKWYKR